MVAEYQARLANEAQTLAEAPAEEAGIRHLQSHLTCADARNGLTVARVSHRSPGRWDQIPRDALVLQVAVCAVRYYSCQADQRCCFGKTAMQTDDSLPLPRLVLQLCHVSCQLLFSLPGSYFS